MTEIERLFLELRRHRFPLGPDDLIALVRVLQEGRGLESRIALRDVCRLLWAKSREERDILDALFERFVTPVWSLANAEDDPLEPSGDKPPRPEPGRGKDQPPTPQQPPTQRGDGTPPKVGPAVPGARGTLPPVDFGALPTTARGFVLFPRYPLNYRDVAQAWRRFRRSHRSGPATELDVAATVEQRVRGGVVTPPVLRPRRRNSARALILIDCQGSMAPFAEFVEMVASAIQSAAQLDGTARFYFHDVPVQGASTRLPEEAPIDREAIDRALPNSSDGWLYRDQDLFEPAPLDEVIAKHGVGRATIVISDAGACHRLNDLRRLIDTIAFLKTLKSARSPCVWLNPVRRSRWQGTTAAAIAEHVDMFPLDRDGTWRAVGRLRRMQLNAGGARAS